MAAQKVLMAAFLAVGAAACQPMDQTVSPAPAYRPAPFEAPSFHAPATATYQPPTLAPSSYTAPAPTPPQPVVIRYMPPPSYSTSLINPTPTSSSSSLLGPQQPGWKPGGGF
jgi:hypothetical protein